MQRRTFLTTTASLISTASLADANWPQWRGPNRDSQVESAPWPGVGENDLSRAWRIPLAPSYSTPIVDASQVYVTETREKRDEVASALDRKTGEKRWEASWTGAMRVPFFASSNGSWIRCTPAVDEKHLYVGGMRDVMVSLDKATGKEAWRLDFAKQFKSSLPSFGFVASPLIDGDFLYIQAGGGLVKVNRKTGEPVWRKLADGGGMSNSAFSSPVIATLGGQRQLVVQTRSAMVGVDLETGEKYWSQDIPAFRGMNILTPLTIGDLVFTSSYQGGSRALLVSRDGGGNWSVKEVWTDKAEAYMSSPVLIDGHIYLHLRNRRVACFEAATGAKRWTTSVTFGKYWSMVANGGQVIALDERGELIMFNATPEKFDVVERRKVSDDESWGHLAISGNQMFVRELNAVACYQWRS